MPISCPHIDSSSLSPPKPSQYVYKDECTRCFDNQDTDEGLDVCLHCFSGGCINSDRHHAKSHAFESQHPLALNIRRRRKIIENERNALEPPLKKLAIEEEREEDMYDFEMRVRCWLCGGQEIEENDKIESVKNGIINSTSSSQKSEVKAWEEELIPCDHSLNVKQSQVPPRQVSAQGAHCFACELNDNLWLCLTCGNLGCGRAQFGGLPGNSHALKHFEESHHPVAVKLGTITAEGEADIYCYSCNDARIDPNLAEDLSNFGINVATSIKTEKNLTELQLEQNIKFDFSMVGDDGKELEPVFGPGLTGIRNLGNSCYMNSTLQSLFSFEQFKSRYLRSFDVLNKTKVIDAPNNIEAQLAKLADGLFSGRYSTPRSKSNPYESDKQFQTGIAPQMLKQVIGKGHPEFSTMRQQDSEEFFSYLLDVIRKDNRKQNVSYDLDPTRIFSFEAEQKLQCTQCRKVRYRSDIHDSISVSIPTRESGHEIDQGGREVTKYEPVDLNECIKILTDNESIEYACPECKTNVEAVKTWKFSTYPDVLVIHARKFQLVNWVPTKLEIQVEGVDNIDISDFKAQGRQEGEIDLPDNDNQSNEPQFDTESMNALIGMGFPEIRAKRALIATDHNGPETAMEWLFAHMEDPDIDAPLETSTDNQGTDVPSDLISLVVDMGFTEAQARKALKQSSNNVEGAVEWLFSNPEDQGEVEQPKETDDVLNIVTSMGFNKAQARKALRLSSGNPDQAVSWLFENPEDPGEEEIEIDDKDIPTPGTNNLPAKYRLKAFVSHKGPSVHSGHYVAHVRVNDNDWVLFNDEKVVKASGANLEELKGLGYLYFFERI